MTTKTLFRWHLWLGVTTGIFLFLIGGSGAIAVFIEEIDWLVTPALRASPRAGQPAAVADALVASVRAAYPGERLVALNLSARPSFAHVARLQSKARGSLDVFLDPTTGRVQGERAVSADYTSTLRNFIRQFHLRLLMGLWGRVFVGFFGVTLVLSCVTGLWIYRGWIKNLFRLRWRAAGSRTRGSDLHKLVGVWSLLFNILVGLTGAVYGYENLAGQIRSHWLRSRNAPSAPAETKPPPPVRSMGVPLSLEAVIARARDAFPDLAVRNIFFPSNASTPIVLRGDVPGALIQQSHVRRVSFIALDPISGDVLRKADGRDARGWSRLYSAFDPLHFGYFGGITTKVIWFILGLAPSALALTGSWLWWRRTRALPSRQAGALPPRQSPARSIAIAAGVFTLVAAYVIVARAQNTWFPTGKMIEHGLAKPLALALTAFPVTGLLAWLAWRSRGRRLRFSFVAGGFAIWYLTLVTLFQ